MLSNPLCSSRRRRVSIQFIFLSWKKKLASLFCIFLTFFSHASKIFRHISANLICDAASFFISVLWGIKKRKEKTFLNYITFICFAEFLLFCTPSSLASIYHEQQAEEKKNNIYLRSTREISFPYMALL